MDQLYDILRKHKLRITPQRKAILQVLYLCRGHHLEIENIYELITLNGDETQKISLTTIYRTMELFKKIGLVSRLSIEKLPARYELIIHKEKHHHLICLKCGRVQEIEDSLIENLKHRIMKDKGFKVADKSVKIYGYCSRCRFIYKKTGNFIDISSK